MKIITKSIFISGLLLMSVACTMNGQDKIEINSPEAYTMLQNNKNIVILDVRTAGEFVQGHVKGAVNIDINQPDALKRINKLDKTATYLVYCRTKNRSGFAVNNMTKEGFKNVYHMMDGIVGWNSNNLPVEK